MLYSHVLAVCIFCLVCSSVGAVKCKDDNNNDVDWFYIYKYPRLEANDIEDVAEIAHSGPYVYMTPETRGKWTLSNFSIANQSSMIANTLDNLYKNDGNTFHLLYNDEIPDGPKIEDKGHTKGVILGDSTGGIWLIHSVPKFPKIGPSYTYPDSGMRYGQSFLCLSLDLNSLNEVGIQLQYNEPSIYDSFIWSSLENKLNNLIDASKGQVNTDAPYYRTTTLTLDGYDFLSVAKSKYFQKDLYNDLLTTELKSSLLVETWLNGRGRLPSNCSNHLSVRNIESVSIKDTKFKSSEDHSKWAVTDGDAAFWACVGDINREESQKQRGGGTMCIEDKLISKAYHDLVRDTENCLTVHSENIVE